MKEQIEIRSVPFVYWSSRSILELSSLPFCSCSQRQFKINKINNRVDILIFSH